MKYIKLNQTGIAHLFMIVMLVFVLAGVGGASYVVYRKHNSQNASLATTTDGDDQPVEATDSDIDEALDDGTHVDNYTDQDNQEVEID